MYLLWTARGVLMRGTALVESSLAMQRSAQGTGRGHQGRRRHAANRPELLATIGTGSGDITVHTDLDLLFADHVSPNADGQAASTPICYVTQGLIRESLFWATGQSYDVEETSCKAMGRETCEFTITGGK
jgi:hypothetical protein